MLEPKFSSESRKTLDGNARQKVRPTWPSDSFSITLLGFCPPLLIAAD
jgi:hypothetical protein